MHLSSRHDPIRCSHDCYKELLISLVLSATACSGDWWTSDPPCSNGAVLKGMDDSSQSIVFSVSNRVTMQELIAVIDLTRGDDGRLMYRIIHVAGSVKDD